MPDGLNFDEMKRQQELVTLRATQNLSKNQNVLIGLHQQTTKYMESPKNGTLSMVT